MSVRAVPSTVRAGTLGEVGRMAKTPSSKRWLKEHASDFYVQQAAKQGYRSRAAFKLIELDERDRLLAPGHVVIDLGAAPGGWSQVAAGRVGDKGRVIATDVLPMDPVSRVEFIRGDFTEDAVLAAVLDALGASRADLVLSDMAPNMSGVNAVDQPRSMYLAELARDCAGEVLKPGGSLLVKVFMGEDFDAFLGSLRALYRRVQIRKPRASRERSREIYVLARGYGV